NNMLYIGTSQGKIFRLKDPGNADPSTAPVSIGPSFMPGSVLVKDIAVNPRNHDTVIAVVSNYNAASIYWTGNATAASPTWDIIEGNLQLPSVRSCEIIVTRTGVEYYVGTTVGLFSTTTLNGASTVWAREDGGPGGMMNTSIVQSLTSRWKDNTMVVGTHGNGMFAAYIGNAIDMPTGVNDPIRDDKNFIVTAYPTLTNNILNFQAGTMLNIKSIQVQIHNIGGQLMYNKASAYASGSVTVGSLPRGSYILTITSNDRKYQFVRRFTKY
ncbi:MAG TPA: T9SS type A sorting domain-containing protein, partial [Chitinophagaceae bacterium]|nr:T9SS type A sorting domain-containing protein [Chitinophagaceae bacterium]